MKQMKIMIGIPIGKPMEFDAVKSLLQLSLLKTEVEYVFRLVSNSLVYEAREELARQFMASDCEYLFFLDSDMFVDPRTPLLLARHNRDIVTAKAFKRVPPYSPCFYTKVDIQDDGKTVLQVPLQYGQGLLPIQGCGMACCLIHRSAFERVPKPWFFPMPQLGEDLAFCYRAKRAGVELFCDTTIQAGHIGQVQILEEHFRDHLKAQQAAGKTPAEVMGA